MKGDSGTIQVKGHEYFKLWRDLGSSMRPLGAAPQDAERTPVWEWGHTLEKLDKSLRQNPMDSGQTDLFHLSTFSSGSIDTQQGPGRMGCWLSANEVEHRYAPQSKEPLRSHVRVEMVRPVLRWLTFQPNFR